MSKIGVISLDTQFFLSDSANLKSAVLLFDELEVCTTNLIISSPHEMALDASKYFKDFPVILDKIRKKYSEIVCLMDYALIKENNGTVSALLSDPTGRNLLYDYTEQVAEYNAELRFEYGNSSSNQSLTSLLTNLSRESEICQMHTRLLSSTKNMDSVKQEYVPLIRQEFYPSFTDNNAKTAILNLIISRLPVIDDSISLSQLKEIKEDKEYRLKYFAFREFVNSLSNSLLSMNEINEKIEYLLLDYEKQLKIHKAKHQLSTIETFIVTSAEMIENIAKLRFGKFAKNIISYRNREIELMEAESKIPGKEIALLYDIKNNFRG